MLYLITGRLGSGKTTHLHEQISSFVKGGERDITLIVPEQFSFQTEKMMLDKLGDSDYSAVSVLSFSRLADRLVKPGTLRGRRLLDEPSKAALMGLALKEVSDKLTLYSGSAENPGTVQSFLSLSDELRQSLVSPETLLETADTLEGSRLSLKLRDIALVCSAYETMLSSSWFDSTDMSLLLCEELRKSHYFKDKLVFIDAFRGFTAEELKIIELMLLDARAVYVSLCMEKPGVCDDTDLFAHTKITEKKLKGIAAKNGISIIKPQNLSLGNKFNNFPKDFVKYNAPELAALEENLFEPAAPVYEDESGAITLCTAPDINAECELAACLVKKLIRENGLRCRDIAVIARDVEPYEAPLKAALSRCGVNVFGDKRTPVTSSPLIAFVLSALKIASGGFLTENFMRLLKTGLGVLDCEQTAELENYAYIWQVEGTRWLHEWKDHPRGYGFPFEEEDVQTLKRLNELRETAVAPLVKFTEKLKLAGGEQAARAIISLLETEKTPEKLKELALALRERGDEAAALEQGQLWAMLMGVLDSFVNVAGDRTLTAKQSEHLLSLMLSGASLGSIPRGLDEVTFGAADRIRTVKPEAVVILGANYGEFPLGSTGSSALNDKDRKALADCGIELASFGEYKLAEEKLIAYSAFCCAKSKLYVMRACRGADGTQTEPSELFTRIEKLFPNCEKIDYSTADGMLFAEGKKNAFSLLAREMPGATPLYSALKAYFGGDKEYEGRLAALERAASARDFRINDKAAAEKLFGKSMYLTASRAEKYYKCPFEYFCEYGMKAKPRKAASIDVLQRGTIIHYVLEKLLGTHGGDGLLKMPAGERLAEITRIMGEYLDELLGGEANKSKRFLHNFRLLARAVDDIAARLAAEFSVCAFRPVDFELKIGEGEAIPAYKLDLDDGENIKICGSIDRVDAVEVNGEKYIRVIDYKSGGKEFALSDVLNGLNMQMLIYLFAVWENSAEHYGSVLPAGVLYYPAKAPTVTMPKGADKERIAAEKIKCCHMQGIVLGKTDVVLAMENDAAGLYIPASINKKTNELAGSIISLAQLSRLKARADELLKQMALSLRSGRIEALPAKSDNYRDVCRYCDYKAVCFHEDGIDCREYAKLANKEVLEALDGEEDENGEG